MTVFPINSIVWGYLLYLALEKRGARSKLCRARCDVCPLWGFSRFWRRRSSSWSRRAPSAEARSPGLPVFLGAVRHGLGRLLLRRSAAEGTVGPRRQPLPRTDLLSGLSLPHHPCNSAMALKPTIAGWPLIAQLALYLAIVCAFSTLFSARLRAPDPWPGGRTTRSARRRGRPLGRRLSCRPPSAAANVRAPTPPFAHRSRPCADRRRGARPQRLHGQRAARVLPDALIVTTVLARASPSGPGGRRAGRSALQRAMFLFALVLPSVGAPPRPECRSPVRSLRRGLFHYRAAQREPRRLRHVVVLLSQRIDAQRRRPRRRSRKPDPNKKLPFVLVPGELGSGDVRHDDPDQLPRAFAARG